MLVSRAGLGDDVAVRVHDGDFGAGCAEVDSGMYVMSD